MQIQSLCTLATSAINMDTSDSRKLKVDTRTAPQLSARLNTKSTRNSKSTQSSKRKPVRISAKENIRPVENIQSNFSGCVDKSDRNANTSTDARLSSAKPPRPLMATGNISSKFPRSNLSRPETLRKLSNSLKPKKRRQSLSTELSTFDFPSQKKSSEIENDTRESAENDDKSHPKRNFGASKICLNVATKRTHPKHTRSELGSAYSSIDTTSGIGFPKPSSVRKVPKTSKTEKS
eukprot:454002_1